MARGRSAKAEEIHCSFHLPARLFSTGIPPPHAPLKPPSRPLECFSHSGWEPIDHSPPCTQGSPNSGSGVCRYHHHCEKGDGVPGTRLLGQISSRWIPVLLLDGNVKTPALPFPQTTDKSLPHLSSCLWSRPQRMALFTNLRNTTEDTG